MRSILCAVALMISATASAATSIPPHTLKRPPAWHPSATVRAAVTNHFSASECTSANLAIPPARAGLRFEPETGETPSPPMSDLEAIRAARRNALEHVRVNVRADGSRYAVLGGLIRGYTVAHIGADGRLVQECVDSEARAIERVQTTSAAASTRPHGGTSNAKTRTVTAPAKEK